MLNALRLQQPISKELFQDRTGLPISIIAEQLNQAQQKELLNFNGEILNPTILGRRFLNDLIALFTHES